MNKWAKFAIFYVVGWTIGTAIYAVFGGWILGGAIVIAVALLLFTA